MENFFINSIQFNWVNLFSSKLKVGVALLFGFMMYACADKEYEVPKDEIVVVESRDFSNCEFFLCSSNVQWLPVSETLYVRSCPVIVTYEWRKCGKGFEIQNFDFTPLNDPNCTAILDSIATFWLANQSVQANLMYNAWFREITLAVQASILPTLNEGDFNPSGTLTYQFIETDCHTLCIDVYVDEFENISIDYLGHIKCGESCCVRVGSFRFDENGDAFIFGQAVVDGDECTPVTVYCPGQYNSELCSPACDRL